MSTGVAWESSGPLGAGVLSHESLPVTFYVAGEHDLDELRRLDPDRDLGHFRRGERSWVLQTYLRLRAAGYPVELADEPPQRGLVVFHAKHKHALSRAARARPELVFVGIRADNSSPLLADFEILQNGRFADDRRRFAVPHWPQAGLMPRDPDRGTRLQRVGYFGLVENLHPELRGEPWSRSLAAMNLEWAPCLSTFSPGRDAAPVDWEDYRRLDVVLAVRPCERFLYFAKPASKLVNAWRAGTPAIAGCDYAFRELRRSDEDYLEAQDAGEALAALRRLASDPGLFERMVANGRRRATEFSFEHITGRWADLLFATIPRRIAAGDLPWSHRLPLPQRIAWRRFVRIATRSRAR